MVQFASHLRRVLCKTRLIFPRISGPIVTHPSLSFVSLERRALSCAHYFSSAATHAIKRLILQQNFHTFKIDDKHFQGALTILHYLLSPKASLLRVAKAFRVTWSKRIERAGLGKRRTGTRRLLG